MCLGNTVTIGGVAGLAVLPFAKPIIKFVGQINVIAAGVAVEAVRFLLFSVIQ